MPSVQPSNVLGSRDSSMDSRQVRGRYGIRGKNKDGALEMLHTYGSVLLD